MKHGGSRALVTIDSDKKVIKIRVVSKGKKPKSNGVGLSARKDRSEVFQLATPFEEDGGVFSFPSSMCDANACSATRKTRSMAELVVPERNFDGKFPASIAATTTTTNGKDEDYTWLLVEDSATIANLTVRSTRLSAST